MYNKKLTCVAIAMSLLTACHKSNVDNKDLRDFKIVNLVANTSAYNPVTVDPTLINAWGIAWSPTGIAWVNSAAGHVSELYNSEGKIVRAPVNIPSPIDSVGGFPSGIVFSGGKGFNLSNGPSNFLFAGLDGVLSGWNGASGNNARRLGAPAHAVYTGLAIAASGGHNYIYAANFGQGKIDVWDTAFSPVTMSFKDPTLPQGYMPYNIQAVGDWLFVTYGQAGPDGRGAPGAGKGIVSVFNTNGGFVKRFATKGNLNLPWGVTMAAGTFLEDNDLEEESHGGADDDPNGQNGHGHHDAKDPVILVGNFGDGRINVYSQEGEYLGQLQSHKHPLVIEGLWALSFPPSTATTIDPHRLYFSAGPDKEQAGVFGYIIKE